MAKGEERLDTLVIFLPTGRTFTFREAQIELDNEWAIRFSYTAMSDGRRKTANFYKDQIAGVGQTE